MPGSERGFSLIELLIVIPVIGLLALIAAVVYQDMTRRSQVAAEEGAIGALNSALHIYYSKHAQYPPDAATLGSLVFPATTDLSRLTGSPNIGHIVSYNPATGCLSITTVAQYHPTSHVHPASC